MKTADYVYHRLKWHWFPLKKMHS